MGTTNRLTYLSTKFFTENKEEYRITVRISLDDDCKNNICDWSITADVDWKNKYGKYEDYLGGCCYDEVAKHFPELAKFISLHLCNIEIADKDAERAMAFLKEAYPFNEETEVFIRKRYNMSIDVDPEEN